jgi:hypothetical protein
MNDDDASAHRSAPRAILSARPHERRRVSCVVPPLAIIDEELCLQSVVLVAELEGPSVLSYLLGAIVMLVGVVLPLIYMAKSNKNALKQI